MAGDTQRFTSHLRQNLDLDPRSGDTGVTCGEGCGLKQGKKAQETHFLQMELPLTEGRWDRAWET